MQMMTLIAFLSPPLEPLPLKWQPELSTTWKSDTSHRTAGTHVLFITISCIANYNIARLIKEGKRSQCQQGQGAYQEPKRSPWLSLRNQSSIIIHHHLSIHHHHHTSSSSSSSSLSSSSSISHHYLASLSIIIYHHHP